MGGFGGAVKQLSIGVASSYGKKYIHGAGDPEILWDADHDSFLESMADAASSVVQMFENKIAYVNVMANMSVDCDCNAHPAAPLVKDMGIVASTDPVALDQACLELVFAVEPSEGNDNQPLVERITSRHGNHIVDYAEKIGLGSKKYTLINIDKAE
jgi:uncharacterized Fe-S center protein